jgi:hypothetical protein
MRDGEEMMELYKSLNGDLDRRKRFDYVIGNPPYIGLNKCTNVPFTNLMKEGKKITMGNVYGVNLHSIPDNRKKYPPKPNLYAFFIALGLALLKEKGKICYIVPLNILSAGDLDVLRYHLAKYTTIEKIITFQNPMFTGRGLRQNTDVATSSLIFVARKELPDPGHTVSITKFQQHKEDQIDDFEKYLKGPNKKPFSILQKELLNSVENWSFIQQDSAVINMMNTYTVNTESMILYAEHKTAQKIFKCNFWFDVGFILDDKYKTPDSKNAYPILNFKMSSGYSLFEFSSYYPKDTNKIGLTKNSQGYGGLGHKYNILWRVKNMQHFHFSETPVIFNMGQAGFIASDNKAEMLYLFSLLNSPINKMILESKLKHENEKEFLVAIKSIKQYIRIPKITQENAFIKKEIIKLADTMLKLEMPVIKDVVEMPRTQQQVFDSVRVDVDKNNLILTSGSKPYSGKIEAKMAKLVAAAITKEFSSEFPRPIDINELRQLPVIDFDEQKRIKDYIDDLVFALYFNVPINSLGIEKAAAVHRAVAKHEFFPLISANVK